jgi:adenosine deaminase
MKPRRSIILDMRNTVTVRLAELHIHLEGTLRPETAASLSARHGLPPPPPYEYSTLAEFLTIYGQVCRSMTTAEDFERVILEHAQAMSHQDIAYAEISFNPSLHPGDSWLDGVIRSRRFAQDEFGVEIAWLVEMVRGAPMEQNERALDIALATEAVAGIGLVGDESISALSIGPLIDRARNAGLGFMPHAGQAGGPQVVREAVEVLGATRVAHGVSAAGDEEVMRLLAEREVCLCVCPSSNARVGLKPDYRKLAAAGISLTVNTDDPAMVGTTLQRELELAESRHGLDREAVIAASWRHRFMGRR